MWKKKEKNYKNAEVARKREKKFKVFHLNGRTKGFGLKGGRSQ